MDDKQKKSLVYYFAKHRLAATLMMVVIFLLGGWAILRLNTQLLPSFKLTTITVRVLWPGASPADVESAVTRPIEDSLRAIAEKKEMTSVSATGSSIISVKFKQAANMTEALTEVRDKVNQVRQLPQGSLKPVIERAKLYDSFARFVLISNDDIDSLRSWSYKFEQELLKRGIAKVVIQGLPKKEIRISVDSSFITRLKKPLSELAGNIRSVSQDVTAGLVGGSDTGMRQVRIINKSRNLHSFSRLPIVTGADPYLMTHLGDIATLDLHNADYPRLVFYKDHPAVSFNLFRAQTADTLSSVRVFYSWLQQARAALPKGMEIHVFAESWQLIKERIGILIQNGATGLILIFALLFLFFNARVAGWVALGIPISLAAGLFALKILGGTINLISLFAMIMSLGIIVDDTIVVAEQSVTEFYNGLSPLAAVVSGARKMVTPIFASSLTTVAAFLPLLLLGGVFGKVLVAIPRVIICVIIASLVEAFLILPMHLKRSLKSIDLDEVPAFREKFNNWFARLRDVHFRSLVLLSIRHYRITISLGLALFVVVIGLLSAGHIEFTFFPSPPGQIINADVTFVAGTPQAKMQQFLSAATHDAWQINQSPAAKAESEPVVGNAISYLYRSSDPYESRSYKRTASILVELSPPENRHFSNVDFMNAWRKRIPDSSYVENLRISAPRAGPPGSDIRIALHGENAVKLKQAAAALMQKLKSYTGVYNISDNLPLGQAEYVFQLRPEAYALGLTDDQIGQQLKAAFTGYLVQLHNDGRDEIEVRLRLNQKSRSRLSTLSSFPIVTKQGKALPLGLLVRVRTQKGFDSLQHYDGELTATVAAEVNPAIANTNKVLAAVKLTFLPNLAQQYGVTYSDRGLTVEQNQTLKEMLYAVIVALSLIFIILAWVSRSYLWPLFVMLAIPMGLEGAIVGHLVLGRDLTLLSLFGIFGLTGIVINDSIILLFRYKELLDEGLEHSNALIEACCQRFRPVLLTSLTTVAGLSPLLFEKSLQARFLQPMAISISFGLLFSTVLILVIIPACVQAVNAKTNSSSAPMPEAD
jgi:multidrug efflux pump subunit AcrB